MRVLVIGGGAREHAIVHALRRSSEVEEVYAAPGNAGIGQVADILPIGVDDMPGIAEAASDLKIDLTVVGPELPLALGVGDEFQRRGLRLFGPSRAGAEIESSKVFAKELCLRHGIPTGRSRTVTSADEAVMAARNEGLPVVMKADGLAGGKGVLMVHDEDDLEQAVETFFRQRRFGDAGRRVLVEELLIGRELSYMVLSDGTNVIPLATSHDYKRVGDGDSGPNTGGMGAHSPAVVIPPGTSRQILDQVVRPTVRAMAQEGREYRGVLYVGLMLTERGPTVLEFNCRFGDPETQVILPRLDTSLAAVLRETADGQLGRTFLEWRREAVACVVMAADGYPGRPRTGDEIHGLENAAVEPGVTVYHSGTRHRDGVFETSGGRVLSVCGRGPTLAEAVQTAYQGVARLEFEGAHYRRDIGQDSLEILSRERKSDEA